MDSLALYVHWPWCVRKCPYCDFNSVALPRCNRTDDYIDALCADLRFAAGDCRGRKIHSVFFGGGTPNLMTAGQFARLFDGITSAFDLTGDCEVSMEANPGAAGAGKFAEFASVGVNRFSLGVQSFDDAKLRALGRIHSSADAWQAVEAVSKAVDNFNIDLMFALPGQTPEELEREVQNALAAGSTHLSFYELTIEEGTAFAKHEPENLPDPDTAALMGEIVQEGLAAGGFGHYEISAYAKPGRRCRHNLTYWSFGDYVGVGAGAHGKVTAESGEIRRTVRAESPSGYIADCREGRFLSETRVVGREDLPFEFMLNVLRLADGVPISLWNERTGLDYQVIEGAVRSLQDRGLMVDDGKRIAPTEKGRAFLSDLQESFLEV